MNQATSDLLKKTKRTIREQNREKLAVSNRPTVPGGNEKKISRIFFSFFCCCLENDWC